MANGNSNSNSNSINDGDDILGNHHNNTVATTTTITTTTTTAHSFVNPKFSLQYTCNVCETKNRVLVSRQAYREGMVVVICKGCGTKHWIADNLDPTLRETPNIEDYLLQEQERNNNKIKQELELEKETTKTKKQSRESSKKVLSMENEHDDNNDKAKDSSSNNENNNNVVHRVSKEVYEIERVWGLKGGVLTDDSGKTVLE